METDIMGSLVMDLGTSIVDTSVSIFFFLMIAYGIFWWVSLRNMKRFYENAVEDDLTASGAEKTNDAIQQDRKNKLLVAKESKNLINKAMGVLKKLFLLNFLIFIAGLSMVFPSEVFFVLVISILVIGNLVLLKILFKKSECKDKI